MDFEIFWLSAELVFVRWFCRPTPESEDMYLYELETLLDSTRTRQYILSDQSRGGVHGADALCQLAELTHHTCWGAAVSYGQKMAEVMYADAMRPYTRTLNPETLVYSVEDALDYLEVLKPGITAPVDREILELLYG